MGGKPRVRHLVVGCITAMTLLALLAVGSYLIITNLIRTQASDARVINLSERQRMLSQLLTKDLLLLVSARDPQLQGRLGANILADLKVWREVHLGLMAGSDKLRLPGGNSPEVNALLAKVDRLHQRAATELERLANLEGRALDQLGPTSPEVLVVVSLTASYLEWMDHTVHQYDREAAARVAGLGATQTVLLMVTLVVLGLLGLLIFMPMVRGVRRTYGKLTEANARLHEEVQHRRRLEREREQVMRLKESMMSVASHDLKTPLTAIMAGASFLVDLGDGSETPHNRINERILSNARVMKRIIEDLLDFRMLQEGRIHLRKRDTDMGDVVSDVVDRLSEMFAAYGIEPRVQLAEMSACRVDRDRTLQVLSNMVHNAVRYCGHGADIKIRTQQMGEEVRVEVIDDGPGLQGVDIAQAFMAYTRLGNKPTNSEKGSGLGLAICRQLVELHGGQVGAFDNEGKGATFWFQLPA